MANAPYGYRRVYIDRRPTLEIFEPEAKLVRVMFQLYAGGWGCTSIAYQINAMGGRPHRSSSFSRNSIAKILTNPAYIGKIVWDQKSHIKKNTKGNPKNIVIYNPKEKWTITDGLHPAIIEKELFDKVQEIMAGRYRPGYYDGTVKSPLAGLVKCVKCGGNMQRILSKGEPYLLCQRKGCCAMAKLSLVESRILEHLEDLLEELQIERSEQAPDLAPLEDAVAAIGKELHNARRQKERLHELLELGEYDLPTYRERMKAVMDKITALEGQQEAAQRRLREAEAYDPGRQAERIQAVLEGYQNGDAAQRNALLHSVIEVIQYRKEKKTKPADFELDFLMKTD